jgi:hypothetical protein
MQQAQLRHFIGHSRLADGNQLAWYSAGNVPARYTRYCKEGTRGVLQPSRRFVSSHASDRLLPARWPLASGGHGHWCPKVTCG